MDEDFVPILDSGDLSEGDVVFYEYNGERKYGIVPSTKEMTKWTGPRGKNIVVATWGNDGSLGWNYADHPRWYPTFLVIKKLRGVAKGTRWRYTNQRMSYDFTTTREELLRTEKVVRDLGTLIVTEKGTVREL